VSSHWVRQQFHKMTAVTIIDSVLQYNLTSDCRLLWGSSQAIEDPHNQIIVRVRTCGPSRDRRLCCPLQSARIKHSLKKTIIVTSLESYKVTNISDWKHCDCGQRNYASNITSWSQSESVLTSPATLHQSQ